MARIGFDGVRHSYHATPKAPGDYALRTIDFAFEDGGAYALLGPSGCGKTTLLNIISGLLQPSEGRVLLDNQDVTALPPEKRNIAQVFQFPVVYDTLSVRENIAFPLRNRGVRGADLDSRVNAIVEMVGLSAKQHQRARGLTADEKQKVSLGRGLVRPDVAAILFDEPLTVIDPHLKWELRSQLKALHRQSGRTMVYVTHDQTEALTFADTVVVMYGGEAVQVGKPEDLFLRPAHRFVGHFIGSPGMNFVPAVWADGGVQLGGHLIAVPGVTPKGGAALELGVRPEHVVIGGEGLPAQVSRIDEAGSYRIIHVEVDGVALKAVAPAGAGLPADARVSFAAGGVHLFENDWRIKPEGEA